MLRTAIVVLVAISTATALPGDWQRQIDSQKANVDKIINHVLEGDGKGKTYKETALLTDLYGTRLSGTAQLEDAIEYLRNKSIAKFGANNVHLENVMVPHWVRGEETASFIMPETGRRHDMYILGIGTSNGTQSYTGETLTAPIIVVNDFKELGDCAESRTATGKIIVYNQPWTEYGDVFMYRSEGASVGARCGATAVLVRSLTQLSVYSPHTGSQSYADDLDYSQHIPAACITTEDADLLQRLVDDGHEIEITLKMEAENLDKKLSHNLYVDIPGTEFPDQYVIFGGHIDSWDVGTGAMDDAGGVMVSWMVLSLLKDLNLEPRRTLRAIFWTAEEIDSSGANTFYDNHKNESVSLIMESDAGTFTPTGIGFQGSSLAQAILVEVLKMLEPINANSVTDDMSGSVDLRPWLDAGQQAAVLNNVHGSGDYFIWHHTEGDTMTVQDPHDMDLCAILWTTVAYVVGQLDEMLPNEEYTGAAGKLGSGLMPLLAALLAVYRIFVLI